MKKLDGKTALITGASRGIGAVIAKEYAKNGAHVILLARDVSKLEEVDDQIQSLGGSATLIPYDLSKSEGFKTLTKSLYERFKKLDILVGNAAILGPLTPLPHLREKDWNEIIAINLTANWQLIRTCDPLLRLSPAGRAIFVSSGIVKSPKAYWGAYTASKAGLEALVKSYAEEVADTNIKVNLVDPGIVRTDMRAKAMPGEDPMTLPSPEEIVQIFVDLALEACPHHGTCLQVA